MRSRDYPCFAFVFTSLLWLTLTQGMLAQGKLPVPSQPDQDRVKAVVKEVFSAEYEKAATSTVGRSSLARTLVNAAANCADPNEEYVLLAEASRLAAESGDIDLAISSVSALTGSFAANEIAIHVTLIRVLEGSISASKRQTLYQLAINAATGALASDQLDLAGEAAGHSLRLGQQLGEQATIEQAMSVVALVKLARERQEDVSKARETLAKDPLNAEANAVCGEYLALIKGDWDGAIPRLALGRDSHLKAAALAELKGPTDAGELLEIADMWWDLASRDTTFSRKFLLARSAKWYAHAINGLSGLAKEKARRRLEQINLTTPLSSAAINSAEEGGRDSSGDKESFRSLVDGVEGVISAQSSPVEGLSPAWTTVLASDADSRPKNASLVLARQFGTGRIIVFGKEPTFVAQGFDNAQFTKNVVEWLATNGRLEVIYTTGHREWLQRSHVNPLSTLLGPMGLELRPLPGRVTSSSLETAAVLIIGNAWQPFNRDELTTTAQD